MSKTKVLVVEDDENLRFTLEKLLERNGFEVLVAEDGVEGIELLFTTQPPPDCIVLDLIMPRANGEDFLRIKRESSLAYIPVVIFSAASVDTRTLEGATIYLPKPVGNVREISEAILRVVRHARATLPPESPR